MISDWYGSDYRRQPPPASYTFGGTPRPIIQERLPHKYDMSLNREDMLTLIAALGYYFQAADEQDADRAAYLRTGILSTLDIEEV